MNKEHSFQIDEKKDLKLFEYFYHKIKSTK